MELVLYKKELKDFLNVFKTINKYIPEITLNISNNNLKIVNMDLASVCLFDITINKEVFAEYKTELDQNITFKTKDFLNCLKNFKEYVKIEIKDSNITLKDSKQIYNIEYTEFKGDNIKKPTLEYGFKTEITNLKDFFKALKTFKGFNDYIELKTTDKNLLMLQEQNKVLIADSKNSDITEISKYSIDYLIDLKFLKDFKSILQFKTDYPLTFSFNKGGFDINYILAPRVETD